MTVLGNSSQQALIAFLKTIGIDINLVSYPAHSTVEEGRSFRGDMPGTFTKNLFLKDKKGRLFLVVAEEARSIDLRILHGKIGARGRLGLVSQHSSITVDDDGLHRQADCRPRSFNGGTRTQIPLLGTLRAQAVLDHPPASISITSVSNFAPAICWTPHPAKPLRKSRMPRVSATFPISTTYSSDATAWRPENFVAPWLSRTTNAHPNSGAARVAFRSDLRRLSAPQPKKSCGIAQDFLISRR